MHRNNCGEAAGRGEQQRTYALQQLRRSIEPIHEHLHHSLHLCCIVNLPRVHGGSDPAVQVHKDMVEDCSAELGADILFGVVKPAPSCQSFQGTDVRKVVEARMRCPGSVYDAAEGMTEVTCIVLWEHQVVESI